MGYGAASRFLEYANIFAQTDVAPPASVCALGDQTVRIRAADDVSHIETFIRSFGGNFSQEKYARYVGERFHVRHVYEDAGFEYVSFDLNQQDGSLPLDLNEWPNQQIPDKPFDVVTNHGTTEHVPNQLNSFATIHYLTKPNGIMVHHIPILHYMAHAMVVATPLFLKKLIDHNQYEIIDSRMRSSALGEPGNLPFHYRKDLEFMKGLTETIENSTLSSMCWLVLRRTNDAAFVPPLDVTSTDMAVQKLMREYIEKYAWKSSKGQRELAWENFAGQKQSPCDLWSPDPKPLDRGRLDILAAFMKSHQAESPVEPTFLQRLIMRFKRGSPAITTR